MIPPDMAVLNAMFALRTISAEIKRLTLPPAQSTRLAALVTVAGDNLAELRDQLRSEMQTSTPKSVRGRVEDRADNVLRVIF